MFLGKSGPSSILVTSTQTVAIPGGATKVTVEAYGGGSGGTTSSNGGGGAGYSRKNNYSLSGLTGIYCSVGSGGAVNSGGSSSIVRANDAGGTAIAIGRQGETTGGATAGFGDVTFTGGNGGTSAGGGSGGPDGNGGAASGATGGLGNGGYAGSGGTTGAAGTNYGGGGGRNAVGAPGIVILTFS